MRMRVHDSSDQWRRPVGQQNVHDVLSTPIGRGVCRQKNRVGGENGTEIGDKLHIIFPTSVPWHDLLSHKNGTPAFSLITLDKQPQRGTLLFFHRGRSWRKLSRLPLSPYFVASLHTKPWCQVFEYAFLASRATIAVPLLLTSFLPTACTVLSSASAHLESCSNAN